MNKLKCKICGFEGMNLVTHLKFKHKISVSEYKEKYKVNIVYLHSDELKKKISDTLIQLNKNPEFRKENSDRQKNGASCLTKPYWLNKGLTEIQASDKISELQKKNCQKHLAKDDLRECSHFSSKYWIKRGLSPEDAKIEVSKLQSKLSVRSSKFLGHIRSDEENGKISDSMKKMIDMVGKGKWASHFGKFNGRSKSEIEFYNYIKQNIDNLVEANVPIGNYIVDVIKNEKIIEFYGDFWHANPLLFSEYKILKSHLGTCIMVNEIWKKDSIRIDKLKDLGYDVLIIWEMDWNKNKIECIEKIKKYLI